MAAIEQRPGGRLLVSVALYVGLAAFIAACLRVIADDVVLPIIYIAKGKDALRPVVSIGDIIVLVLFFAFTGWLTYTLKRMMSALDRHMQRTFGVMNTTTEMAQRTEELLISAEAALRAVAEEHR